MTTKTRLELQIVDVFTLQTHALLVDESLAVWISTGHLCSMHQIAVSTRSTRNWATKRAFRDSPLTFYARIEGVLRGVYVALSLDKPSALLDVSLGRFSMIDEEERAF